MPARKIESKNLNEEVNAYGISKEKLMTQIKKVLMFCTGNLHINQK